MSDRFSSFKDLSDVFVEGVDFSIESRPTVGSDYLVLAPHGGKIEPFTSELAARVALDDYSLYTFEGHLGSKNRDLHITSHLFFEPTLDSLLEGHPTAVAFHGRSDDGDPETIFFCGLDGVLISELAAALRFSGFKVASEGHKFPGAHSNNTCNRSSSGKGVQFELPTSLRELFKADRVRLALLVTTIRSVLRKRSDELGTR